MKLEQQINYEPLKEWKQVMRQTYISMAQASKDRGAKIHADTIGRFIKAGQPLPSQVILAWKEAYDWSWEQMVHYCLGGPPHLMYDPREFSEHIVLDLGRLKDFLLSIAVDNDDR